ncbi:MAG: bifunctional phosphoribosylaminoimidazolecarboxamide formyltransferase/IMP cyclohydrolase, partial [Acidimicrobiia bacterium]
MSRIPVRRAIVSVADKSGLEELGRRLAAAGAEIVSSGGTAAFLARSGVAVTLVSDVTGMAEMFGGRVKTLHPSIHGGILADLWRDDHRADLEREGIKPIDLVVVNLYPFSATVSGREVGEEEAIEQIDIGGPTLIRAAAKNHARVGVVTSHLWYEMVAAEVEAGGIDDDLRRRLAREAFFHTAAYDAAIVTWLEREEELPARLVLPLRRQAVLRYGENPHQKGALYLEDGAREPWTQYHGKEMSFNNHLDADAAWRLVQELEDPGCAIVKHTNPCGVARAGTPDEAFRRAWGCDPRSAYGGVVAVNRPLDRDVARAMTTAGFVEVVIAPTIRSEALDLLEKSKNLRVLAAGPP